MPMVVYTEEECNDAQRQGETDGMSRGQQERDRLAAENTAMRRKLNDLRDAVGLVVGSIPRTDDPVSKEVFRRIELALKNAE